MSKQRVQTFSANSPTELDTMVNEFLKSEKGIKVQRIAQSSCPVTKQEGITSVESMTYSLTLLLTKK